MIMSCLKLATSHNLDIQGQHASISFSVMPKHCLSCSCAELNEHDLHRPPKPMSSSLSFSKPGVSIATENLGLLVRVCSSVCADSSVAEF